MPPPRRATSTRFSPKRTRPSPTSRRRAPTSASVHCGLVPARIVERDDRLLASAGPSSRCSRCQGRRLGRRREIHHGANGRRTCRQRGRRGVGRERDAMPNRPNALPRRHRRRRGPHRRERCAREVGRLSPTSCSTWRPGYGTEAPRRRLACDAGLDDTRLSPDSPVLTAGDCLRHHACTMAVRLTDAVLRRTTLGSGGHPGEAAVVAAAADVMARVCGWDASTRRRRSTRRQRGVSGQLTSYFRPVCLPRALRGWLPTASQIRRVRPTIKPASAPFSNVKRFSMTPACAVTRCP